LFNEYETGLINDIGYESKTIIGILIENIVAVYLGSRPTNIQYPNKDNQEPLLS